MQAPPLTLPERNKLLAERQRLLARYNALRVKEKYDEADAPRAEASKLSDEYFERLPRLILSCCPYDDKPLLRTFDPFGLDGLWWEPSASPDEPPACTHFCVLLGAVHYNGLPPRAGGDEVWPGPEVPYVLPRLLEMPGMIAVISQVPMEPGYTAYPIAYFAEKRPPVVDLTAGWAREIYSYVTQLGESGWRFANDLWDFDLKPWLQKGKIRWCPPGSDNTELSPDLSGKCPYVGLPGRRENLAVQGPRLRSVRLPDGTTIVPWD